MTNIKLSVFTPTHSFEHLEEAWKSLHGQDYGNFEWIVAINGNAYGSPLPTFLSEDPRIRVIEYPQSEEKVSVGMLKRFCCDNATGDALVEFDHDDLLAPGILRSVATRIADGAGFVYSDTAVFTHDEARSPKFYGPQFGWETYPVQFYGHEYQAQRAFPVTARSLCDIWFSPDHVRAWSRDVYKKLKGHDPKLHVGDDHDLLCRTYLSGCKISHTGTCGYLYRDHPGNTVKERQEQITKQSTKNRDKYIYRLIDAWTQRSGLGYLDLTRDGKVLQKKAGEDWTIDVPPNSLGCVRAYKFFEYLPFDDAQQIIDLIYLSLAPGGWFCAAADSTEGYPAFAPDRRSHWNPYVFSHFTEQSLSERLPRRSMARFQSVRCFSMYPDDRAKKNNRPLVYADFCAVKGQRQPGIVNI